MIKISSQMITSKTIIPQPYNAILNKDEFLTISVDKQIDWAYIFEQIIQSHHQGAYLQEYYNPKLLNSISAIYFSKLEELYLDNNLITNIESVAFINAPLLQYLFLAQNLIVDFSPLVKTNFKSLSVLSIVHNCSKSLTFLKKVSFGPSCNGLFLEMKSKDTSQKISQSRLDAESYTMQFLLKTGIKKIRKLNFQKQDFIVNIRARKFIQQRFDVSLPAGEQDQFSAM